MNLILNVNITLNNIGKKNIILGKNGCGKSYVLKQIQTGLNQQRDTVGTVRYLSPERGGVLSYDAGVEQSIAGNPLAFDQNRRQNQTSNFRQQSFILFRRLELSILRNLEKIAKTAKESGQFSPNDSDFFDTKLTKLNTLLDRVQIEKSDTGFQIINRSDGKLVKANETSSGESELISLGIEILWFQQECDPTKKNYLLIDEPDVHLHPDLQDRLATFLIDTLGAEHICFFLATHSTALVGALANDPNARVAFMRMQDTRLDFLCISEEHRRILPIFGAHPLSNVFRQAPILLVEGDDDERIWQQAVRSSEGKLNLHPCGVDSVNRLNEFEKAASLVMSAVYEQAVSFSLRDRDEELDELNDIGSIRRMRLHCRAAENLLVSDDVLALAGVSWLELSEKIREWERNNSNHSYHSEMRAFIDGGMHRRDADLKDIRNILVGLITKKPWEVIVGQAIANLVRGTGLDSQHSIRDYLGPKVCENLLNLPTCAAVQAR